MESSDTQIVYVVLNDSVVHPVHPLFAWSRSGPGHGPLADGGRSARGPGVWVPIWRILPGGPGGCRRRRVADPRPNVFMIGEGPPGPARLIPVTLMGGGVPNVTSNIDPHFGAHACWHGLNWGRLDLRPPPNPVLLTGETHATLLTLKGPHLSYLFTIRS